MTGYQGRSIYLDSDMQVFKDIKALWVLPFNGAQLLTVKETGSSGRRPQFSVMLLDCAALKWRIDDIVSALDKGELDYESLMNDMSVAEPISANIDPAWSFLERYQDGETALG
jgi:lipopolysaccharide biosynthesis glycosyltransferase